MHENASITDLSAFDIATLLKELATLRTLVEKQSMEIEHLKDEIRRLKELKTKPKISASRMNKNEHDEDDPEQGNSSDGAKRPGSKKRNKTKTLPIHKTEIIKVTDVPEGTRFKGYKKYFVQGIEIKPWNVLFKLECWQLPDGSHLVADLPAGYEGHHFSPELRAYILHQHHHQGVTQPLLLSQLREWGIDISSGQLNCILIENKELFHEEKQAILESGLAVSKYIQVDDTGARHDGKNGYCTHIGNELFAWFESTRSKSRINFLELLRGNQTNYVISEKSLAYMKRYDLSLKYREQLSQGPLVFECKEVWEDYLTSQGLTTKHQRRLATEGALIGSILMHGFNRNCVILSDDAGQFNVFQHALCWIHAERKLNELIPHGDIQIKLHTDTREAFWNLYKQLKEYKKAPTLEWKEILDEQFNELCVSKPNWYALTKVLKKMMLNKSELLLVLERPEIPLHNNLSESDIREYVKKRKVSGSTRSEEGRRCRDTFTSLKKTCKKLRVKFWDYLLDRLQGIHKILPLPTLIKERALEVC